MYGLCAWKCLLGLAFLVGVLYRFCVPACRPNCLDWSRASSPHVQRFRVSPASHVPMRVSTVIAQTRDKPSTNGTKQQPNCTAVLRIARLGGSAIGNRQCKSHRQQATSTLKILTPKQPPPPLICIAACFIKKAWGCIVYCTKEDLHVRGILACVRALFCGEVRAFAGPCVHFLRAMRTFFVFRARDFFFLCAHFYWAMRAIFFGPCALFCFLCARFISQIAPWYKGLCARFGCFQVQ